MQSWERWRQEGADSHGDAYERAVYAAEDEGLTILETLNEMFLRDNPNPTPWRVWYSAKDGVDRLVGCFSMASHADRFVSSKSDPERHTIEYRQGDS